MTETEGNVERLNQDSQETDWTSFASRLDFYQDVLGGLLKGRIDNVSGSNGECRLAVENLREDLLSKGFLRKTGSGAASLDHIFTEGSECPRQIQAYFAAQHIANIIVSAYSLGMERGR